MKLKPTLAILLLALELSSAQRWGTWSRCSKSCGGGTQTRRRFCIKPELEDERNREIVRRTGGGGGDRTLQPIAVAERRKRSPREPVDSEDPTNRCPRSSESRKCNTKPCPNANIKNPTVVKSGISFYGFSPRIVVKDTDKYRVFKSCIDVAARAKPARGESASRKRARKAGVAPTTVAKSCKVRAVKGIVGKFASVGGNNNTTVSSLAVANVEKSRTKRSTPCSNIPNFLPKVASGLDASVLDLLAPAGSPSTNGVENNLFQFTCDFGRKLQIGTTEYDLPDQISNVYSESVHDLNLIETTLKTSEDVKEVKSRELSGSGAFSKLSFSGSYTYKRMRHVFKTEQQQHYDLKYTLASLLVNLNSLPIDDEDEPSAATNFIDNRLRGNSYTAKPRDYQNFIQIYGTHASHRSRFGGMMHGTVSVEKSYAKSRTETQIKRQAKAAFGSLLSVQGVSVNTGVTVESSFRSNSETKISCFGGSANVGCTNVALTTWLPSVEQNPHLLSAEALLISDYVSDDQVRTGLDIAICRHLALSYLPDLIDRINGINGLQAFAPTLRSKYTSLRTEAQGHLNVLRAQASSGQHEARCNQVRDTLTYKAETLLAQVTEGGLETKALTPTGYDAAMNSVCPAEMTLSRIKSTFSSGHRDRSWQLYCSSSAFSLVNPSSCSFTTNYLNDFHKEFLFNCPANGAVTGLSSYHNSNRKIEDRRFKVRCCGLASNTCATSCSWTTSWTAYEGGMDFAVPAGRYLAGVRSKPRVRDISKKFLGIGQTRKTTDRIWKFKTCQVTNC